MELRKIVKFKKDTRAHMDATLAWMREQDDFDEWTEPRKVYNNGHIGKYVYERNRSISMQKNILISTLLLTIFALLILLFTIHA